MQYYCCTEQKRFRIRKSQQFYDLANYLLANYTNLFSFNQLMKALNFKSVPTIQKFTDYLSETYLFLDLTRFSIKIKAQMKSSRKFYIIDNGFVKARSYEISPSYGRLLENCIFIELLRRHYRPGLDLFYYRTRNDREIDFICREGHITEQLIQVCYDISDTNTFKREINALVEASGEVSCKNLLLLTWDNESELREKGSLIKLIPVWKWLTNTEGKKT